jgi:hypothetical protein
MNWKKYWLLPFVYMLWVNELVPPDPAFSVSGENMGLIKAETGNSHYKKSISIQNKNRFEAFSVRFIFV